MGAGGRGGGGGCFVRGWRCGCLKEGVNSQGG